MNKIRTCIFKDKDRIPAGIIYEIHCSGEGFFTIQGVAHNVKSITGRTIRSQFILRTSVVLRADANVNLIVLLNETQEFSEISPQIYNEFECTENDISLPQDLICKIDLIATAEGNPRNIFRIDTGINCGIAINNNGQTASFMAAFPSGIGTQLENYIQSYEVDIFAPKILKVNSSMNYPFNRVGFYTKSSSESKSTPRILKSALGIELPSGRYQIEMSYMYLTHIRIGAPPGARINIESPEFRANGLVITEDIPDFLVPIPNNLSHCHELTLISDDAIYVEMGVSQ